MLKWNTYVLLVFAMLLTGLKVSGQSNPVPFNLGGGNYLFNTWSSSSLAGTYPANMFLHTCSADSNPSLGDPTTGDYTGVYNSGTGNRFTGLAASGLSMFNKTKTPSTVGAVVIGLNTTGRTNILVSFESRSWASGNAYNLRLQYRISTVSPWLDVPGPIEYIYTGVIPNTQTLSVNLSTATANAVDNRSNMQLRWKYYYVSGFLASSNNIGLDEINISSSLLAQIPTNGLVGYWPFNGNANDISGNANNGIVTGATLTNDRFGNPSSAYTFNGTSNFITSTFAPFTTPPFTISAWVKIDSLLSLSPIVSIGEMGSSSLKRLYFSPNYFVQGKPSIGTGGANDITSTFSGIIANTWTNIIVTCSSYTAGGTIFYVNGIGYTQNTIGGSNVPVPMNNSPFTFGRHTVNSGVGYFSGIMDDVVMYNRVLNPNEIAQIYTPCNGTPISSISAIGNTTFCQGSNVILTLNDSYATYQWQKNNVNIGGAVSKTYTSNSGGTYRCIVNSPCGIDTSNTISLTSLTNKSNTVLVTGNTSFCIGDSVTLNSSNVTAGYSYQWYRNNIAINGATSNTFIGKNPGTYKVVTKNVANGCSRISSNGAIVSVTCRTTNRESFIGNIEPLRDILVYPNPNEGSFTMEIANENIEDGVANFQVMNVTGQVIFNGTANFSNGFMKEEINLERKFNKGLYLVKVQIGDSEMTEKVMLQ